MNKDLSAKILTDAEARGFKPISGTTVIECPECKGRGKDYGEGGFDSDFADCPKCDKGVIKHKWKIAVVLENGELPKNPYPCDTPEHTQRHFACTEGFGLMSIEKYRQVVE